MRERLHSLQMRRDGNPAPLLAGFLTIFLMLWWLLLASVSSVMNNTTPVNPFIGTEASQPTKPTP